ncbi:hypothetical protein ACIPL1_26430 [Pseudomonas sp. NPDC090202]|uniref:hypothetical protein n=1 Tax=unclassified Pseudomonas TaxID=196821 RepID=UPI0037FDB58F
MPSSLDALRNQILDAEPVLKTLDAEMEKIQFDPLIPASVDAANEKIGRVIETLLSDFKGNPILGPLAVELKAQYLEGIEEQVAAARAAA